MRLVSNAISSASVLGRKTARGFSFIYLILQVIVSVNLFLLTLSIVWAQPALALPFLGRSAPALSLQNVGGLFAYALNEMQVEREKGLDSAAAAFDKLIHERWDPEGVLLTAPEARMIREMMLEILEGDRARSELIRKAVLSSILTRNELNKKFAASYLNDEMNLDPKLNVSRPTVLPQNDEERVRNLRRLLQKTVAAKHHWGQSLAEAKSETAALHFQKIGEIFSKDFGEALPATLLNALVNQVDPHANYFSPEALQDFHKETSLKSFGGIGVVLGTEGKIVYVKSIAPGGPAAKSGILKEGDQLVSIGTGPGSWLSTSDLELSEVIEKLRGLLNTEVKIQIRRPGENGGLKQVSLIRAEVERADAVAKMTVNENGGNKTAVITLSSFYFKNQDGTGQSSFEDVSKLVQEASEKNVEGIVLDLSKNLGGSLDEANKIGGIFLGNSPVVGVRHWRAPFFLFPPVFPPQIFKKSLVVLTSRESASAAELLSAALQDHRRALIIGCDRTFGKGSVQQLKDLGEKLGAFKFTRGLFYRPSGDSLQHKGVTADIRIPMLGMNANARTEEALAGTYPSHQVGDFREFLGARPFWRPVQNEDIAELSSRSKSRIEKDAAFSDILKENKATESASLALGDWIASLGRQSRKEKTENLIPEIRESIAVLNDLISLHKRKDSGPGCSDISVLARPVGRSGLVLPY